MGVMNGFLSSWVDTQGGSNSQITELIAGARMAATAKLYDEAVEREADGVVGTSLQLVHKANHFEVLAIGSTVLSDGPAAGEHRAEKPATPSVDRDNWLWSESAVKSSSARAAPFLTACSGEQFYCLLDCGFVPKTVVFGNDAYSRGLGGFLRSAIGSTVTAGEVPAISDVFNHARNAALARLRAEAHAMGCPFVSGVEMQATSWGFVQEVAVRGTACTHPSLRAPASPDDVLTSSLAEADLWAVMEHHGALPAGVVSRTGVFNVGFGGMVESWLREMQGGEITRYNEVLEQARQSVMYGLRQDALELGAEEIVGLDLEISEVASGLIEVHATGTAVKYGQAVKKPQPLTDLPPQALHVSRVGLTESFGRRSAGKNRSAADVQHGSGKAGSAADAQAAVGYNVLNLGLNVLNKMVKK